MRGPQLHTHTHSRHFASCHTHSCTLTLTRVTLHPATRSCTLTLTRASRCILPHRPDRDDYVKIHWDKLDGPHLSWRPQYTMSGSQADTHRPYNYNSIMHYPAMAPLTVRDA